MQHNETGWFLGEVTDHGFATATTGTDQIFLSLRSEEGHEITAWLAMTEKSIEHTVKKLRACGFTGFDFSELADGTLLRGNQVRYQVIEDNFGGQRTLKVGWINDPTSRGIERSTTAAANCKRFNEILKQHPPDAAPPKDGGLPF